MPIEIRKATSKEMKKNIRVVKMMTRGMQFDENMAKVNWKAVRRISGIGYTFMPREKGVKVYRLRIGNGKSEISIPENVNDGVIVMYIHGGGFVSGSAASSRGYCSMLAKATGYKVVAVDYRLAPENPYPSGLDDCYEMFCKLAQKYPKAEIVLCGESAGANLCLALCHRINAECDDSGIYGCNDEKNSDNCDELEQAHDDIEIDKRIAAVIVHSPFMDFTGSLSRGEHEVDDFTVKEGCLPALNEIYVGKHNADDSCVSPLYGYYKNFPPTFITCDYNETLYADSMELYHMCEDAGVDVRMIQMQGAFHAFATMGTGTPETMKILEDMKLFIKKSIHKNKTL
ncbi:MAG: alpha/beta hydrolase [Lachnospiraceae bacterium]|nr:alpha/beta hydrolase [Lachnospiraceae bacterium]